jgi:hypothetical protein
MLKFSQPRYTVDEQSDSWGKVVNVLEEIVAKGDAEINSELGPEVGIEE